MLTHVVLTTDYMMPSNSFVFHTVELQAGDWVIFFWSGSSNLLSFDGVWVVYSCLSGFGSHPQNLYMAVQAKWVTCPCQVEGVLEEFGAVSKCFSKNSGSSCFLCFLFFFNELLGMSSSSWQSPERFNWDRILLNSCSCFFFFFFCWHQFKGNIRSKIVQNFKVHLTLYFAQNWSILSYCFEWPL